VQIQILAATQASNSDNFNKRYIHSSQNGRQFAGATDADCSDATTPAYQASLERFYASCFTTIDNFDLNDAILKTAHNVALDRFIATSGREAHPFACRALRNSGRLILPKYRAGVRKQYQIT
jgi:hypothetical protein